MCGCFASGLRCLSIPVHAWRVRGLGAPPEDERFLRLLGGFPLLATGKSYRVASQS